MELKELSSYAKTRYHMKEERKWDYLSGFTVLTDPETGSYPALFMREWSYENGVMLERCDLKCPASALHGRDYPFVTRSFSMKGPEWIGLVMDDKTDREAVFHLFDEAVRHEREKRFMITLENKRDTSPDIVYADTSITESRQPENQYMKGVPDKIVQMRSLYQYGKNTFEDRCRNFYVQGKFMEDYEDDLPWTDSFKRYFPVYHDLNIRQLRGYFTWRKYIRKGEYRSVSTSLAYMYIYELLNGIGTSSPEDSLLKMQQFEDGYIDSGIGDVNMRRNLRQWILAFCILHNLDPDIAAQYLSSYERQQDQSLMVLKDPEKHTDEEICTALEYLSSYFLSSSPVIRNDPQKGMHFFARLWKTVLEKYNNDNEDFFAACFGQLRQYPYYPLGNAVYYDPKPHPDTVYMLSECKKYICQNNKWKLLQYEKIYFNQDKLAGLLHEADLLFRKYLKTGHYLRKKADESWAEPCVLQVIQEDRQAQIEASRPKITIDFTGLDKIRSDAAITRESLLSDEEKEEEQASPKTEAYNPDSPLNKDEQIILHKLLKNEDAAEYMQERHLFPSVIADHINEVLFDEIGDSVLVCDGKDINIVEDYRDDLAKLAGGS